MLEWINFPGGLSQNDWFTLFTGTISTAFGVTSYNQNAYCNNVGWRQAQLYQDKNYHLAWIAIAREDIREMMSVSVSRIDNYNLVATLVLAVAAEGFLGVEFVAACPSFIVNSFRVSMGVSIMFLAMAIMFGIHGQNSAFMNTMNLLTWELRPENPPPFTHDYMQQAQQYEKDGTRQLFRMPGMIKKYHFWDSRQEEKQTEPHEKHIPTRPESQRSLPYHGAEAEAFSEHGDQPALEELTPVTRNLVYLERFAHFMQLWVPYDLASRYCMGLGLLSLSHGATYFSLSRIESDDKLYTGIVACTTIVLFLFLTMMIFSISGAGARFENPAVKGAAACFFVFGPISGTLAMLSPTSSRYRWFFGVASAIGHVALHGGIFASSFFGMETPREVTKKYTTGPHGQAFPETCKKYMTSSIEESFYDEEGILRQDSVLPRMHCPQGNREAPSVDLEEKEEELAKGVQKAVAKSLRISLGLSTSLWVTILLATFLDEDLVVTEQDEVPMAPKLHLTELPLSWAGKPFRPHALACAGGSAFLANKYQVVRVSAGGGAPVPVPCNVTGSIADVVAVCDGAEACRPLALLSGGPPWSLVDCASGEQLPLRQEPARAEYVALRAPQTLQRGKLLALHGASLVEYRLADDSAGWTPLWEVMGVNERLHGFDFLGDRLFFFGSENASLEVIDLSSLERVGKWSLPLNESKLAAGCIADSRTVLLLPAERTPSLWTGKVPT